MLRYIYFTITFVILSSIALQAQTEKKFRTLFDGTNLNEWDFRKGQGFRIEEGILITDAYGQGTDIYTKEQFGNFILRLEFMLSDVGNSGVFIRRDPENSGKTGFEVQLLAPWTPWRDDLHCTASLYGHKAVTNRPDETTGIWYEMEIVCDRNNIVVSVDGVICTQGNTNEISSLKNRNKKGSIGLQFNHAEKEGQWTKFRNIRIRNLDKEVEYVAWGLGNLDPVIKKQSQEAALAIGSDMIAPLAFLMSENNPAASSGAKQALFDITAKMSSPEVDQKKKEALASILLEQAEVIDSDIVKKYLIWLTGMLD